MWEESALREAERSPRMVCGLYVVAQRKQEEQCFHMEGSILEANRESFTQAGMLGGIKGHDFSLMMRRRPLRWKVFLSQP